MRNRVLICLVILSHTVRGDLGANNQASESNFNKIESEWSSQDSHWVKVASVEVEKSDRNLYPSKVIEWSKGDEHWKLANSQDKTDARNKSSNSTIENPPGLDESSNSTINNPPGLDESSNSTVENPPGLDESSNSTVENPPGLDESSNSTVENPPGLDESSNSTIENPPVLDESDDDIENEINEENNSINNDEDGAEFKNRKKSHDVLKNVDVKTLSPDTDEKNAVLLEVDTSENASCIIVVPASKLVHLRSNELDTNLAVPPFISTSLPMSGTTFGVHMSHKMERSSIGWAIVVVKLPSDKFGEPVLSRAVPDYNIDRLYTYEENPGYNVPYIAGTFGAQYAPYEFVVGDQEKYGGYTNGALEPAQWFGVFVAAIVSTDTGRLMYAVTGWLEDAHARGMPAYFRTAPGPSILLPLGLIFFIVGTFVTMIAVSLIRRSEVFGNGRFGATNRTRGVKEYKFSKFSSNGGKAKRKHKKQKKAHVEAPDDYEDLLEKKIHSGSNKRSTEPVTDGGVRPSTLPRFSEDEKAMPSYPGNHLRRHFKDDDQLEETVFSMHPEDHPDFDPEHSYYNPETDHPNISAPHSSISYQRPHNPPLLNPGHIPNSDESEGNAECEV